MSQLGHWAPYANPHLGQFIEVATCRAQNKTVGHSLQPHTKEIRAITVPHPSTDHPIVLVDTPGLDDTKFDAAIWSMIIVWLRKR